MQLPSGFPLRSGNLGPAACITAGKKSWRPQKRPAERIGQGMEEAGEAAKAPEVAMPEGGPSGAANSAAGAAGRLPAGERTKRERYLKDFFIF
jgi:hypothetical protein